MNVEVPEAAVVAFSREWSPRMQLRFVHTGGGGYRLELKPAAAREYGGESPRRRSPATVHNQT